LGRIKLGRRNINHNRVNQTQAGFTLLEILLVIVMIAVTAAMVVPSISSIAGGDIDEESSHLRSVMAFALEESQLSGQPIRWLARKDGWSFEAWVESFGKKDKKASWQALAEPPLEPYTLPEDIVIQRIDQAGDAAYASAFDVTSSGNQDESPILGVILLLPDGTTSQSNVYLEDESNQQKILQVRPGPAGIRLKKEGEY
jgi:type II secretion system protein H